MRTTMSRIIAATMRAWDAKVRLGYTDQLRPSGPLLVHGKGADPDRVLLFGKGVMMGWGVLSHDLALPGHVARALSARTGRGADVTVEADLAIDIHSAVRRLDRMRLARFDAIVLSFGISDATRFTSIALWQIKLAEVLDFLGSRCAPSVPVLVLGLPRIPSIPGYGSPLGRVADHRARRLNEATAEVISRRGSVTFVPIPTNPSLAPERQLTPREYGTWAELVAEALRRTMEARRGGASTRPAERADDWEVSEAERSSAVEAMQLFGPGGDESVARAVKLAQSFFGTKGAGFTVVDGDRHWVKLALGCPPQEIPRHGTLAAAAIESRSCLVVGDAQQDSRFRAAPTVAGDPHVRFYAGFPIDSPSGARVGVLFVADPEPRDVSGFDEVMLRDFGVRLQAELWRAVSA